MVLFRQLSFNESCLGAVFVLAVLLLLSPDSHMGSQLMGMATILFSAAFSPVYAGCVVRRPPTATLKLVGLRVQGLGFSGP